MKKISLILNLINFFKKSILQNNDLYLKVFDRNIQISKEMVGLKLAVYNGKFFIPLKIKKKYDW